MGDSALTFRAAGHKYWIGDRELISLTRLLEEEAWIDTRFYTEEGKLRGTTVHVAAKLDDEGVLEAGQVPQQWLGYVDAWAQFKEETGFVVEHAEYRTCNESLGVACTIDRIGSFQETLGSFRVQHGRLQGQWILELKTGGPEAWHWLQLAGQRECLDFATQVGVVYLKDDGGYTFVRRDFSEHLRDRRVFKDTIERREWKRRNNCG